MRKLLGEITAHFRSFIEQRDELALVVCSAASDAPPILKILEGLEDASASDFFWTFTDGFSDAEAYANAVVAAFSSKHEAVRLAMEAEEMSPWPPIPPTVLAEDAVPALRLRELAVFSRELLPIPNSGRSIWVFYPLEIADHSAFAQLMVDALRHDFPFPWCHHLRFIIREDPADRALLQALADSPRVEWFQPDLSAEAMNRSMEEELTDEELPLAERLDTLMILAASDYAYQRYPEALEKYELLLQYHAPTGNLPMAAISLNGMGEVYEKTGDPKRAGSCYEAALAPASQGEHPPIPVLLNVVLNLANLRMEEQRWEESEAYYDLSQQLATVARNAPVKIQSLENRGVCQSQLGRSGEAAESWKAGATIAQELKETDLQKGLLERLKEHYARTGQAAEQRETLAALDGLSGPPEN